MRDTLRQIVEQVVSSCGDATAPAQPAAAPPAAGPHWRDAALAVAAVAFAAAAIGWVRANERRRRALALPPRPVEWAPYATGGALGVVIAVSLVALHRPVGISGAILSLVRGGGLTWPVWIVVGVVVGAYLRAAFAGQFRVTTMPGEAWTALHGPSPLRRWAIAFACAFVIEYAAAIAGGCTSGLALSGGIALSPGAFVFMAAMFAAGIPAAFLVARRRS